MHEDENEEDIKKIKGKLIDILNDELKNELETYIDNHLDEY